MQMFESFDQDCIAAFFRSLSLSLDASPTLRRCNEDNLFPVYSIRIWISSGI